MPYQCSMHRLRIGVKNGCVWSPCSVFLPASTLTAAAFSACSRPKTYRLRQQSVSYRDYFQKKNNLNKHATHVELYATNIWQCQRAPCCFSLKLTGHGMNGVQCLVDTGHVEVRSEKQPRSVESGWGSTPTIPIQDEAPKTHMQRTKCYHIPYTGLLYIASLR